MAVAGFAIGVLNSETTKARTSPVQPERAGMGPGIAATMRFIGITVGLAASASSWLAAVAEGSLRRPGAPVVSSYPVDWHALNLRVAGGALSVPPEAVQVVLYGAVSTSVASGFAVTFAAAAVVAAISSALARVFADHESRKKLASNV